MRTLESRQTVGLGIATAIVVVVASLVAVFGIVPFPEAPTLAEQPEPAVPGRLAYLRWDDGSTCLHVADGAGNDTQVRCDVEHAGEALRWTDDGYVVVTSWGPAGREEHVLDPVTGDTVETRAAPAATDPEGRPLEPEEPFGERGVRADGTVALVDSRSGRVEITIQAPDGTREIVWEATGPERYRLDDVTWSPDGEWLLVRDSQERLLVLGADGDPAPRTWVEDAGWEYAWYMRGATG